MNEFFRLLSSAIRNKVIHYVLSRYFTYLIQFVNSLLIAVYLGPYYLGIWGFITLIIKYLDQLNLGIAHSVNAMISVKRERVYEQQVVGVGLTLLTGLVLIFILIYVLGNSFGFTIGDKYQFWQYSHFVIAIGLLGYFNGLLSNVYRVQGRINEIAIHQSAVPLLMLISILLFGDGNKSDLLNALIISNVFGVIIPLIVFLVRSPIRIQFRFSPDLSKIILKKGWYLFIYNTSFYLIIISSRSFISGYYSVKEFGYFTFGYTLASVVLLLLQSFSFLIFPKLLNKLANGTIEQIQSILRSIRSTYIYTSHFLIHSVILCFPIFISFFPEYAQSERAFMMIALVVVLYTNSFGYSGLLIAKDKEKTLAFISFFALVVNVVLSYFFINVLDVSFDIAILATALTYFLYVFMIGRRVRIILGLKEGFLNLTNDLFPPGLLVPYFVSLILVLINVSSLYYFLIPFGLFIGLNIKVVKEIRRTVTNLITNPKLFDI